MLQVGHFYSIIVINFNHSCSCYIQHQGSIFNKAKCKKKKLLWCFLRPLPTLSQWFFFMDSSLAPSWKFWMWGKSTGGVRFWEFGKVGQATNTSREPTFVFVFCSPFFHLHAIFSWLYFVEQCDLFFVAIVSISLKGLWEENWTEDLFAAAAG